LKIEKTDWYLHLNTKELENYIQKVDGDIRAREMRHLYYKYKLSLAIGTPEHGLLIDSQLSEELYSLYKQAEIISEASAFISNNECRE